MNRLMDVLPRENGTPVIPLMGYPGVPATGNSVREALTDLSTHVECLRFLEQRYRPAGLFFIMDLTVEAEAVGAPVEFGSGPPSVSGHPVASVEDLAALEVPDPSSDGRMPLFLDVVKCMRERFSGMPCCYCIGPFTLAAELVGAEELAVRTLTDEKFARCAIAFCTDVVAAYARALARHGAGAVAILEPTAVILSGAMFESFCIDPLRAVAGAIREEGAFPILHICGDTTHLLQGMARCSVDGLSLDHPVDLSDAFAAVPHDVLVVGNIDPVGVMTEGTPAQVRDAALDLLCRFGGQENFVLSSGCDLPPETPLANIDAFFEAVGAARS